MSFSIIQAHINSAGTKVRTQWEYTTANGYTGSLTWLDNVDGVSANEITGPLLVQWLEDQLSVPSTIDAYGNSVTQTIDDYLTARIDVEAAAIAELTSLTNLNITYNI